jgi:hypothetical protein
MENDAHQVFISFEPKAVAEHYEGTDPDPIEGCTEEELADIGMYAAESFENDDAIWEVYERCLDEAVERVTARR